MKAPSVFTGFVCADHDLALRGLGFRVRALRIQTDPRVEVAAVAAEGQKTLQKKASTSRQINMDLLPRTPSSRHKQSKLHKHESHLLEI